MKNLKELLFLQSELKQQIVNARNNQNKVHLVEEYRRVSKKIIELDIEILLYVSKYSSRLK